MPQPSTRAIIFDCFGVLYDDAFKQFVEHYVAEDSIKPRQYYYDLSLATDRGLITDADFYAELTALSGQPAADIRRRMHDITVLNDDVVAVVMALKPHYRIGMVSNAQRNLLDEFISNHNLGSHFDMVLASSETPYVKPQREIFEIAAERLEVSLPEIIFIDDSPRNTSAAAAYGLQAITYRHARQLRHDLAALVQGL